MSLLRLRDTGTLDRYSAARRSLGADSDYSQNPGLDLIDLWHWGDSSFRGYDPAQPEGLPSTHVTVPHHLKLNRYLTYDAPVHVDAGFPYEDVVGMAAHLGSMARSIWNSIRGLF